MIPGFGSGADWADRALISAQAGDGFLGNSSPAPQFNYCQCFEFDA